MKSIPILFSVLFFAISASGASIVEFKGTAATKTVGGITITIHPEATVDTGAGKLDLNLSGSGIRQKSVAFLKVNVYALSSWVEKPADFKETNPIEGIKSSRAKVLQLTILRSMSGDDVRTAFEDALDLNGVDLTAEHVKSVLGRFNQPAKPGEVYTVAGFAKNNADQVVNVDFPTKTTQDVGKDLADDFWKVWFGIPIDAEMKVLQKALIGK